MEIALYIIAGIVVVAGLVGTVIPMMPGVPLVFIGLLIAAAVTKFSFISVLAIVIMAVLMLSSLAIDYLSGMIGAKYSGASTISVISALAGSIVGVIVIGPLGILLGPAVFVFVFELILKKSVKRSARSASYTFFSTIIGIILNALIALTMLGIFIGAIFIK